MGSRTTHPIAIDRVALHEISADQPLAQYEQEKCCDARQKMPAYQQK